MLKLFITGGSGFIGSNYILKQLKSTDNKILNFDKLTYAAKTDNLSDFSSNPNYFFIQGDICDKNRIMNTINDFRPDAIIHFAAESHVDRSIDDPLLFVKTNVLGTSILLDCVLKYWKTKNDNTFRFIHVSTDEVFGSLKRTGLFDENSPYKPNSPYSASKASSDHIVRSWFKTYSLPAIITNCSNNYGPFQFPEKLIPLIISNCIDEKPLPVYGDGTNIRDWLFVDDHCNAIDCVLYKGEIGSTYCIGGNNEIKNIDIVKIICKILDEIKPRSANLKYVDLVTYVNDRPGHDFRYAINSSKINNQLNWSPKETFNTGIRKTIEWYLKNENWWRKIQSLTYS